MATVIFAIALDAAKLQRVNPNKARGGGGRGRRIVKRLRNGRQGRQLFGSRVPILPAAPFLPPAPLPAAPIFGPHPPPFAQPLQLIELQPVLPKLAPVVVTEQGINIFILKK